MRAEIIQGTGEDGADLAIETFTRSFMNNLRARQEAVWGVLSHGRVVVDVTSQDSDNAPSEDVPAHCAIYLPERYKQWWDTHQSECSNGIVGAMCGAWGMSRDWAWDCHSIHILLDVPQELVHFVAENTNRPKPRRYNSTAVTSYFERDG